MNVDLCSNLLGLDFSELLVYVTDLCCLTFKTTFTFFFQMREKQCRRRPSQNGWTLTWTVWPAGLVTSTLTSAMDVCLSDCWRSSLGNNWSAIPPSIHHFLYPSMYPFIHLCIHPSLYVSIYISIHACIHPSISNKPSINQMPGCCDNHYTIIYYICFTYRSLV